MKILVLATDYPNNQGGVTLMYIHSRNRYYIQNGVEVDVLNFSAHEDYIYDNINVITLKSYISHNKEYQLLISHAPNIRNHFKFLKQFGDRFERFIFFFHGHEVLRIRETYSEPFSYVKQHSINTTFVQDIYDSYKLYIWRNYLPSVKDKSTLIFVSEWMKNKFEKYVKLKSDEFRSYVIPNNIGDIFQTTHYNPKAEKKYDFITIRNNLDGSKYCIDIINELAYSNPNYNFLVVGRGDYFLHNNKANNLTWQNTTLTHAEIPEYLNSARSALMLTRLDAQGVMMCEMASFGIPVITSNIDICIELSKIFDNFIMISNKGDQSLAKALKKASELVDIDKNTAFFTDNTVGKELDIILNR